jgi:hypothetical protein
MIELFRFIWANILNLEIMNSNNNLHLHTLTICRVVPACDDEHVFRANDIKLIDLLPNQDRIGSDNLVRLNSVNK